MPHPTPPHKIERNKFTILLCCSYPEVFPSLLCHILVLHFNHGPTQETIFTLSPVRHVALFITSVLYFHVNSVFSLLLTSFSAISNITNKPYIPYFQLSVTQTSKPRRLTITMFTFDHVLLTLTNTEVKREGHT